MEASNLSPNLIGSGVENYRSLDTGNESRLKEVGKDFESVFLSLLLKEMRNTLSEGGFFGNESSDSYGSMFDLFVGQHLAESSPLGISEMVLADYTRNQSQNQTDPGSSVSIVG